MTSPADTHRLYTAATLKLAASVGPDMRGLIEWLSLSRRDGLKGTDHSADRVTSSGHADTTSTLAMRPDYTAQQIDAIHRAVREIYKQAEVIASIADRYPTSRHDDRCIADGCKAPTRSKVTRLCRTHQAWLTRWNEGERDTEWDTP